LREQPGYRGQRRLGAHDAALAFETFQQRGLLAAHVCAGGFAHFQFETFSRG